MTRRIPVRHTLFIWMATALALTACAGSPAPAPAVTPSPASVLPGPVAELAQLPETTDVTYLEYAPPRPDNVTDAAPSGLHPAKMDEAAPAEVDATEMDAEIEEAKTITPTRVITSARVPILMYHYLSVPPAGSDKYRLDLSVSPANFEAQLKWLKENNYTTIRLDDLYDNLAKGTPIPKKSVILTFDDGYRDFYENAYPLLKKYGFAATVFVISDYINSGNAGYLTWPMVTEMSKAGISIESHSRTHLDLRGRSYDKLVWEILGPIEAIEAYTGKRPRFFCYPMGYHDETEIRVLKSVGTLAAVTTAYGKTHTLDTAMLWSRVRIHGTTTLQGFASLVGD